MPTNPGDHMFVQKWSLKSCFRPWEIIDQTVKLCTQDKDNYRGACVTLIRTVQKTNGIVSESSVCCTVRYIFLISAEESRTCPYSFMPSPITIEQIVNKKSNNFFSRFRLKILKKQRRRFIIKKRKTWHNVALDLIFMHRTIPQQHRNSSMTDLRRSNHAWQLKNVR